MIMTEGGLLRKKLKNAPLVLTMLHFRGHFVGEHEFSPWFNLLNVSPDSQASLNLFKGPGVVINLFIPD